MSADNKYIIMGKTGSSHGLHGWLKIRSFTEKTDGILDYNPWYFETKNGWEPFRLEKVQRKEKFLTVKLAGIESPEQAKYLSGKEIAVKRSQLSLPDENEYYWADLVGLTVMNQENRILGKVISLLETGANDVLIVGDDQNPEVKCAIPWLPDSVIVTVDLGEKRMRVNWDVL
jgi:16S rRNA processing protein RimM